MAGAPGLTAPLATEVSGDASTAWFPEPCGEPPQQERPSRQALEASRPRKVAAALGAVALALLGLAGALRGSGPQGGGAPTRPPGEASLDLARLRPPLSLSGLGSYTVFGQPAQLWQALRGVGANATGPPPAPERELGSGNCERLIKRFDTLDTQHMGGAGSDPEFPDSLSSIAAPGAECGDTAAGIHKSCDEYNNWASFQDVAKKMHGHFDVMAGKGPEYADIGQGELGTCYFLAALASIAHSDPKVIENMFVKRGKWASHSIFTTRWLLDGKERHVEVDNKVPAYKGYRPFFVQPSETGEWWPVILEKTWAKIFGNYKAVEGGIWENAVKAITMAPVVGYPHQDHTDDEIFNQLLEATHKGWPMGAGTTANCVNYGLAQGHAYSILNASTSPKYGKVVTLYNPWRSDRYKGSVPNTDTGDGVFSMKISEYRDAFRKTSIAKVNDNYHVSAKQVQTEASKMTGWEFSVTSHDPFYVTLSWPGSRIVEPCDMANPTATLAVSLKGAKDPLATGPRPNGGVSHTTVEVTHGPGDYIVLSGLDFPAEDKVHEGHLTVYSESPVTITATTQDVSESLMRMFGPTSSDGKVCSVVSLGSQGTFELQHDKLVHGFPTYWSPHGGDFSYWVSSESKWFVAPASKYDDVKLHGKLWSLEKLSKDQMTCGCKDSPQGVAGFDGVLCTNVKGAAAKYANVKCHNSEYSNLVQRFCPKTCEAAVCSQTHKQSQSSPTTPTPSQAPHTGTCEDVSTPGIALSGKQATCAELGGYCQEYPDIRGRCCATCAKMAETGKVSSGSCQDFSPPGIQDGTGSHYSDCAALKDQCSSSIVKQRCCATCKAVSGVTDALCPNGHLGFLQPKDGTEASFCSYLKPLCGLVANDCCVTCSA